MAQLKVNLGCGKHTPAGWNNVDYAFGARLAKLPLFPALNRRFHLFNLDWSTRILLHDLTKPFPWGNDSVDVVYSSHTLEHLTRGQGREFLGQCFRILKHGGIARIVVPDLEPMAARYVSGDLPADRFLDALGVAPDDAKDGPLKRKLAFLIRHPHRCMYDRACLVRAMEEAGFAARRREARDSDIEDIDAVELRDVTHGSVIMEGKKP